MSTPPNHIKAGASIDRDGSIKSTNGKYDLVLQGDGNFCVYAPGGRCLWASNTWTPGSSAPVKCTLENDGNLRLLDPWGREKWSSGTGGKGNASSELLIQDDGNVVINTDGKAVWSTNTAQAPEAPATTTPSVPAPEPAQGPPPPDRFMAGGNLDLGQSIMSTNGQYTLVMQGDNNCCLNKKDQGCIWARGDGPGIPAKQIRLRTDGELEVLTLFGDTKWQAGTAGRGNEKSYLQLRDDGNMVIVTEDKIVWSSMTGPALPEATKTSMKGGDRLLVGEKLTSPNGKYSLTLNDSYDLVLAEGSDSLWTSVTRGYYGGVPDWLRGCTYGYAQLNAVGTLEIFYDGGSKFVSQEKPNRAPGDVVLTVQDDGVANLTYNDLPLSFINVLKPGDIIRAGQTIQSPSGEHQLTLLPSGNLQVYHISSKVKGIYETIPNSKITDATYLTVRGDLIVEIQGADKRSIWCSPNRQPSRGELEYERDAYRDDRREREYKQPGLLMSDDATAYIQASYYFRPWAVHFTDLRDSVGDALRPGTQLKFTQCLKSQNGQYSAFLDGNGDFQLMGDRLLWRSKTSGADSAWMNSDGGLCVGTDGKAVYQSNPGQLGGGDLVLVVQDDGNMCIYLDGNCKFSSQTAHGFPNIDAVYF
ncbi:uncharacterized protein B0J16DRAFT_351074 [Fusarium flagelliforme]|uniref:Het-domain-containing protein n=1 Tax=Fusarium flagelliforme TaxID=2675880 RepID=A0A395MW40_9HYPO|nr:uncharacterized protein B0J16DRAFT_351074 [Fusarium flagelliforme]KAH7173901.1 hypothetical protein B0J16DRAFT_351074 [Fusarium flagelliforme]RFN51439.1 het-domain-containing protein [Fusarium flagelliforme]